MRKVKFSKDVYEALYLHKDLVPTLETMAETCCLMRPDLSVEARPTFCGGRVVVVFTSSYCHPLDNEISRRYNLLLHCYKEKLGEYTVTSYFHYKN